MIRILKQNFIVVLAALTMLLSISAFAQAQPNSGVKSVTLNLSVPESITLTVNQASVTFTPNAAATSATSSAFTFQTAWQLEQNPPHSTIVTALYLLTNTALQGTNPANTIVNTNLFTNQDSTGSQGHGCTFQGTDQANEAATGSPDGYGAGQVLPNLCGRIGDAVTNSTFASGTGTIHSVSLVIAGTYGPAAGGTTVGALTTPIAPDTYTGTLSLLSYAW